MGQDFLKMPLMTGCYINSYSKENWYQCCQGLARLHGQISAKVLKCTEYIVLNVWISPYNLYDQILIVSISNKKPISLDVNKLHDKM